MSNIISITDFISIQNDPDIFIADCRYDLSDPLFGLKQYRESHIAGAVFVSLKDHLSVPEDTHGGRHPLPDVGTMEETFGQLGIKSGKSHVIAYDDAGNSFAARLWWMLRYLGHPNVQVLDGGFAEYCRQKGRLSSEPMAKKPAKFTSDVQKKMLATMKNVQSRKASCTIVDARARERFRGEIEPIDKAAGHIPGAVNLPWMDNVDAKNLFKPRERLDRLYKTLSPDTIMYCGSGVTSCLNVLIMEELGYPLPRLYAGSWSDWISYKENPVAVS